jgi:hypothetical protein
MADAWQAAFKRCLITLPSQMLKDDATLLPSRGDTVKGKKGMQSFWTDAAKAPSQTLSLRNLSRSPIYRAFVSYVAPHDWLRVNRCGPSCAGEKGVGVGDAAVGGLPSVRSTGLERTRDRLSFRRRDRGTPARRGQTRAGAGWPGDTRSRVGGFCCISWPVRRRMPKPSRRSLRI